MAKSKELQAKAAVEAEAEAVQEDKAAETEAAAQESSEPKLNKDGLIPGQEVTFEEMQKVLLAQRNK